MKFRKSLLLLAVAPFVLTSCGEPNVGTECTKTEFAAAIAAAKKDSAIKVKISIEAKTDDVNINETFEATETTTLTPNQRVAVALVAAYTPALLVARFASTDHKLFINSSEKTISIKVDTDQVAGQYTWDDHNNAIYVSDKEKTSSGENTIKFTCTYTY